MKLLCCTQFYPPSLGGMQLSNELLIEGLARLVDGIDLHVFAESPVHDKVHPNIRIERHCFDGRSLRDLRRCALTICRLAEEARPDHVLLFDEAMVRGLGTLSLSAKPRLRAPISSVNSGSTLTRTDRHLRGRGNAWLVGRGYRWLARLFVAQSTADTLARKLPEVHRRVRVLGRPVADWFFDAPDASVAGRRMIGGELPLLFGCARAIPEKGVHLILEALANLRTVHGREVATFAFAGEGPALALWKQRAQELKLEHVRFLGRQSQETLLSLYDASTACVFSSAAPMETFGRTWVEAFARRRPVISTTIDNLQHLVRDQVNGFAVEPNPGSIAEAVDRMLSLEPAAYAALCAGAFESAQPYRQSVVVATLQKGLP